MILDNNSTNPSIHNVQKTENKIKKTRYANMQGVIGSTWNGGMLTTVAFKKVYAGTTVKDYTISGQIRMLTPLAPLTTRLTTTFKAYFVPNSRVWTNAENFSAHKATTGNSGKTNEPYVTAQQILHPPTPPVNIITDFKIWRECIGAMYLPRMNTQSKPVTSPNLQISILPFRGYKAIYNDFERNKSLDNKMVESNSDTVTPPELETYFPLYSNPTTEAERNYNNYSRKYRGVKRNNYYTNFRTQLTGALTTEYNESTNESTQTLPYHTEWQKTVAEARQAAENQNLNDWEIIAKLRGTRPATQGKVKLLGVREVGHNYSQVAQTVYNDATPNTEFQSLGTTGAYSWTEFSIDLIKYENIIEDGYIHIIAQTSADTIFSTGINRELLNVNWDDQYRPELSTLKDDVLKKAEYNTTEANGTDQIAGYKRKFSEIFELPNHITGDLTENGFINDDKTSIIPSEAFWLCQETNMTIAATQNKTINTSFWKDNSDNLINNTMALKQPINEVIQNSGYGQPTPDIKYEIDGKNQFKLMAECRMIASLPIDPAIMDNYENINGEV